MIFLIILSILTFILVFANVAVTVYVNSNVMLAFDTILKKLIDVNDMTEEKFRELNEKVDAIKKDTKLNRVDLTAIRDKVRSKKAKKSADKV